MHKDYPEHPNTDSHIIVILEFDNGSTGIIDTSSKTCLQEKPRYLIHGTEASFMKMGMDLQESVLGTEQFVTVRDAPENYGRLKTIHNDKSILIESEKGDWLQFYRLVAQSLTGNIGNKQFNPKIDDFVTMDSLGNFFF